MTAPMTVEEWAPLTPAQRRQLWRLWTTEQRLAMYGQLAASTPGFALPYPDDYNDPADSPAAFRELALATDAALGLMVQTTTAETQYVKSPEAVVVSDWNQALYSGFYSAQTSAANSPNASFNTWWMGIVIRVNANYVHQLAWPAYGYNPMTMEQRWLTDGVWSSWGRVVNYPQSWDTLDNFITLQHTRASGHPPTARFAHGMKKDEASVSPTNIDEWRVQCYDMQGVFTFSAIKIPEDGIVSMPRGHSVMLSQLKAGEAVKPEAAATVGMVVEIVREMLAGVEVVISEAADDGSGR